MITALQLFLLAAYLAALSISRSGGAMPEPEPEPDDQRSPDYCWTHNKIETTEEER